MEMVAFKGDDKSVTRLLERKSEAVEDISANVDNTSSLFALRCHEALLIFFTRPNPILLFTPEK